MNLSRAKPANTGGPAVPQQRKQRKLELESFVEKRDYTGAIALLEFYRNSGQTDEKYPILPWLGYCAFHLGDYKKSMEVYQEALKPAGGASGSSAAAGAAAAADPRNHLYLGCCYFYLGMYKEAEAEALKGPQCSLQTRLLFHLAHKFNDENKLMMYHQKLHDTLEDQLSLASIHYLRSHFQEATEIYKKKLLEHREYLALNVYIALCYYKLDYYDVSLEVLEAYLQKFPDSAIAINLKACNKFRLYNGKVAEEELKVLMDLQSAAYNYENDLVKHNLVVFRNGENAGKVLYPLLDIIPEARLNLAIYHLRNDEVKEADELLRDLEPVLPQEYILKGVVNAAVGQIEDSPEHLKMAQQYFQLVGASASECDTIPGRQCMASCFFLLKQFDDVLLYLKSIKSYFYQDDDFNWNYGIALASCGQFEEAEEKLLSIQSEKYKSEYAYLSWLARCFIFNKKSKMAWELYLRMDTSTESFALLQLIANDCYRVNQFFYSAKAFDVLERLDPNPEYWEGKRGACIGIFQQVVAGQESTALLRDVMQMLLQTTNPEAENIVRIIQGWARSSRLDL